MLIPVGAHTIFVRREGTGRPIVLIHGLGTPSVWNRVWGPLSASHDLVNIHLPGFGSSEPSKTPLSCRDHAMLVKGVVDHLHLQGVVLMGISYGGQVAATLAAMRLASITSLVLICPSGLMMRYRFLRWDWVFRIVQWFGSNILFRSEGMIRRLNGKLYFDPANQPPEIVSEFFQMIRDPARRRNWFQCVRNGAAPEDEFMKDLSLIHVPTLILWGKEDAVIPVRFAAGFQELITDSSTKIFDRCGHAVPLECGVEVEKALRSHLGAGLEKS